MMARRAQPPLPKVTDAHRLEAFERMKWVSCSYEQAMADPIRARCIEARAHQLRTQQWQRERLGNYTDRVVPSTPRHPLHLSARPKTDLKRAAAGDVDD